MNNEVVVSVKENDKTSYVHEVCPELEYVHRGSPGSLGSPNTLIEYI